MKQSQWWMTVGIGAVLVFIITFAMNFVGSRTRPTSKDPPDDVDPGRLDFTSTQYPKSGQGYRECELLGKEHQDFWFMNSEAEQQVVGVVSYGCSKCTSTEMGVLDDASPLFAWGSVLVGLPVDPANLWTLGLREELVRSTLTKSAKLHPLSPNQSVPVPAGAVGFVRLIVTGDQIGRQLISSQLWINQPGREAAILQARFIVHRPIRTTNLTLNGVKEETLPRTDYLICWSSTRSSLALKVTAPSARRDPKADPIFVGKPIALTPEECKELEVRNNQRTDKETYLSEGRVLCAYKIPFTLSALAQDGKTPFDIGPFRRKLQITADGVIDEPAEIDVFGRITGLVEVGEDGEGRAVNLGSFLAREGKRGRVEIRSNVKGLRLELDRERTPSFLDAEPKEAPSGQEWTLDVQALPGQASGDFSLQPDSAVYLRAITPDKRVRSLRIPVAGTATIR